MSQDPTVVHVPSQSESNSFPKKQSTQNKRRFRGTKPFTRGRRGRGRGFAPNKRSLFVDENGDLIKMDPVEEPDDSELKDLERRLYKQVEKLQEELEKKKRKQKELSEKSKELSAQKDTLYQQANEMNEQINQLVKEKEELFSKQKQVEMERNELVSQSDMVELIHVA